MFPLKPSRSTTNPAPSSSSSSTPLSSPCPTKSFPTGLQSPLQLSTPPLSDTSDSTLQSASSDGWSPTDERGFDEARARGRSQQAESEGSSGGARGFEGFFKRVRSSSRGRKKEEQQPKIQQRVPPVPAVPSGFRLSLGLGAMGGGGAGMGIRGDEGVNGDLGISMGGEKALGAPAKAAPGDGGDLGDLLYLVHAAGDRFTSETSCTDWSLSSPSPPPVLTTSQRTTPTLLHPSAFSSPGSPPSPATPKPYYSFLSHLGNNNLAAYQPMTPPSSPPILRTPPPPKPESEDDYGGSSSDEEALWNRKPSTSFGRAQTGSVVLPPAPKQVKASRPPILSPTRARRRALGPHAKEILDYTLLRLSPGPSTLSTAAPTRYQPSSLHHPLSTTPRRTITAFGPTNTVQVVLGRTLIARKLLSGLTMLESMDLERGASRRRSDSQDSQSSVSTAGSFDEAAPRPATPSLTSLIDTFEIDVDQPLPSPPSRPALSPLALSPKPPLQPSSPSFQPARLRSWIARPPFADSHLNTLVIEGGIEMVDLVRPSRGKVPKLAVSERLKAMAGLGGAGATEEGREKLDGRPSRERPPSAGAKGGQQRRGGLRASSLPPPSLVGRKPVLPGPLLLRALAEKKLNGTGDSSDEEDLPLAVLCSRGSSTPASATSSPAASSASTTALQKAQARAERLEAEVSKLRKQEEARKASLTRMQREKEQREMEWEEEKREEERKRRVAEQRRRSRATGQVEERSAGSRSSSKDRQRKRASAAPPSKQKHLPMPSPSAYAAPFLPPAPSQPWAHPQMLAIPPPGWGIVPVPVMMPLPSPNTLPFYSPQPSPLFSTSAPSHTSTSPFSTFAQAGSPRPPPPPLPHSHLAPNRISHRSTSQGQSSSNLKPTPNAPTSMRRSSSHGPPLHRSSRHAPPPLPSSMASGKRVSFKPSASVVGAPSVSMGRSRSTPESDAVERERAKAREQLVGGAGAGGRKLVRRQ